jgi:hypothetical protein
MAAMAGGQVLKNVIYVRRDFMNVKSDRRNRERRVGSERRKEAQQAVQLARLGGQTGTLRVSARANTPSVLFATAMRRETVPQNDNRRFDNGLAPKPGKVS